MWEKERERAHVPSMSSSWPWLPSRVRDRKGAKSTKISLSKGATFSRARSSLVVMLLRQRHDVSERSDKTCSVIYNRQKMSTCSGCTTTVYRLQTKPKPHTKNQLEKLQDFSYRLPQENIYFTCKTYTKARPWVSSPERCLLRAWCWFKYSDLKIWKR